MFYRINPEANGDYISEQEERVALLETTKPAPQYQKLYKECSDREHAVNTFGLRYEPLPAERL